MSILKRLIKTGWAAYKFLNGKPHLVLTRKGKVGYGLPRECGEVVVNALPNKQSALDTKQDNL